MALARRGGAFARCPAALSRRVAAGALWLALAPWGGAQAGVLRYCDPPAALSATQQDRLLRFGAVIKSALDRSGQALALVARSGVELGRFGQRYSHAGISLRASPNGPWSVRQLYYDCDQSRPRIFDQGIAGFLLGGGDPALGYVSVLLLPAQASGALEQVVLDNRRSLGLLGAAYSANAYPFSLRYQNCNQWVVEMLAVAWGGLAEGDAGAGSEMRADAQRWLQRQGYAPTRFELGNPLLMWLAGSLPWLHSDDHPPSDLAQQRLQVSMPESIEAFVRASVPGARRIQFCQAAGRVVVRHGWEPIAEGCEPGPGDEVTVLE